MAKSEGFKIALRMFGVFFLTVVVLMAALLIYALSNMFNKHPELNARPAPDKESSEFVQLNETAKRAIESEFQSLGKALPFQYYGSISPNDFCRKGQNNWKVYDGYAHRCFIEATRYYGFDADFLAGVGDIENAVSSTGWSPIYKPENTLSRAIAPNFTKSHGKPTKNFPGGYFVSDLPTHSGRYAKPPPEKRSDYAALGVYATPESQLLFEFAEKATINDFSKEIEEKRARNADVGRLEKRLAIMEQVIEDHDFMVELTITNMFYDF